MLKRVLCLLLSLCIMVQALPLSVFSEMLPDTPQKNSTENSVTTGFEIDEMNISEGIVTVISPVERSATVVVSQYKNGVLDRIYTVESELVVGKNTITIPDYVCDNTAMVKVMLFDSMENMRPLCESLEIGKKLVEVTFDTGDPNLTVSKRTYPSNTRFGKLPTLLPEDGLFVGWYYDNTFLNPVFENDRVVNSCTLYAKIVAFSESSSNNGDETDDNENILLAEQYVAYTKAPSDTKVLILSSDNTMTADEVLSGITTENLSVFDDTEEYCVERYTVKNAPHDLTCESAQQLWLDSAKAETVMFVFSAKAEDGFEEGKGYRITLDDERLSFAGHSETAREYNVSVSKELMSNLSLRDDIIFVDEALVNDTVDGESDAQLLGETKSGSSQKSNNRFSLGNGTTGKIILSSQTGGRQVISITEDGTSGDFIIDGTIIGSAPGVGEGLKTEELKPEDLNNKTVAVYSRTDNSTTDTGDTASILGEEGILSLPDNLTLDDSALWNMEYRTIQGVDEGTYTYTETNSKNILFKPDVFPMLETEDINTGENTIEKENIVLDSEKTIKVANQTVSYEEFGITEDTTIDVGDFIAFIKEENGEYSCNYAEITNIDGESVEYIFVDESEIISSMDMYGERSLSAKEMTGLDDFTELENKAEAQAEESGFVNDAAMYLSTSVIASEAFSDLSKEYGLNCEEIREDLINLSDSGDGELLGETGFLYQSKNRVVTIEKPTVEATVNPKIETKDGGVTAGLTLTLVISGSIVVDLGENPNSTITINYSMSFTQTVRAEIVMTAEAKYRYILFIPIIEDCTINANIDFYTTTDVDFEISVGLESDGNHEEVNKERVYVTPYGRCYHRKKCFYLDKSKANGTLTCFTMEVMKNSTKYRPCSRCCPSELLAEKLSQDDDFLAFVDWADNTLKETTEVIDDEEVLKKFEEEFANTDSEEAYDAEAATDENSMPASLVLEKMLIDKYQTLMSNSYSEWAELYRLDVFNFTAFSFFGIINVTIGMDFCLYANLNLALQADVHYENAKRFIFTINPFKGEVKQEVLELVPEQIEFNFMAMGTAGLKCGVELAIGVNLICDNLAQISVTGEVGLYIKLWGYFMYHYKKILPEGKPPEIDSSCQGALYIEMGPYVDIGFSASVFGTYGWYPSLYYEEFPLVKFGQRNAVMGFENISNETVYRLRQNYNTLALPKELLSVAYLDLRTGKTGNTAYMDELKNATKISSNPLTYVSEHYTFVIINDDNDNAFSFNPESSSIVVTQDDDVEENGELVVTYNQPELSFNRTPISKRVSLYWDNYGDEHTIVLDTNGGNYLAPIIKRANEKIELPEPVRTGYSFNGWMHDGEKIEQLSTMPNEDMTLIADWTPNKVRYTVNHWQYDINGIPRLCDTEDDLVAETDSYVTTEPKKYTGFKENKENYTVKINGDGSTVVDYYYEREEYKYTLKVNNLETRRMVRYGEPIVLTERKIPGYKFIGWFDNNGTEISDLISVGENNGTLAFNYNFDYDLTLTAKFEALEMPYRVEFYNYVSISSSIGAHVPLGEMVCEGKTDDFVDLTDYVKKNDLLQIYEDNKESFEANPDYKLEEWEYDGACSHNEVSGTINADGSLVLKVYFKKIKRSITYQDGGFSSYDKDIEINTAVPMPESNPSKTGFTFTGWNYYKGESKDVLLYTATYNPDEAKWEFKDSNNNVVEEILMQKESYTTEAIWTPNKYTITFYDFNNNVVDGGKISVDYGADFPDAVNAPICDDGYTFDGYYNGDTQYYDGNGKHAFEKYEIDGNIELYPKKKAIEYSICYVLNDDESGSEAKNPNNRDWYTVENNIIQFADPERVGYAFEGWFTTDDFADEDKISGTEGYTQDLTLYAKWSKPENIIIQYTLDGGTNHKENPKEYTVETVELTLYKPTRTGYKFEGWESKTEGVTVEGLFDENGVISSWKSSDYRTQESKTNGITFVAKWSLEEYTITWEAPNNASILVYRNSSLKNGITPGYMSGGDTVYYGDELSIEYKPDTGYKIISKGNTDITVDNFVTEKDIFAKAEAKTYIVKYFCEKPDNATHDINSSISEETWTYDSKGTLPTPTLEGWRFDGWYSDEERRNFVGEGNAKLELLPGEYKECVELYDKWTPKEYKVIYHLKKPDNATHDINFSISEETWTYDSEGTLPTPTLEGWRFDGWYSDEEFSNFVGEGNAKLELLPDEYKECVDLYAKWSLNEYEITWNTQEGASITVKRVSSCNLDVMLNVPLSSGDMVYLNDKLEITYTADPGYTIYSHGETNITVTDKITSSDIYVIPQLNSYMVTWDAPSNATIEVIRKSSRKPKARLGALYSGEVIYHYDELEITYTADPGYTICSQGKTNITVTDKITSSDIYVVPELNSYTVTWDTPSNAKIEVKRKSSRNSSVMPGKILSNGDVVYHYDELEITYTADSGYTICSQGKTNITVTDKITSSDIYVVPELNSYTVTWDTPSNAKIEVKRKSSRNSSVMPGKILSNGDVVYHYDELEITYTADTGHTIYGNGNNNIIVTGNVSSESIYAYCRPIKYTVYYCLWDRICAVELGYNQRYYLDYYSVDGFGYDSFEFHGWYYSEDGVNLGQFITSDTTACLYNETTVDGATVYIIADLTMKECFTGDTQVTLSNGSSVRLDSLNQGDLILSWNAITGAFETMPISLFWNHGEGFYDVIRLFFSNGKIIKVVTRHGFFDATLNKYVYIDSTNYDEYIGHEFACLSENGMFENVTLLKGECEKEWSSCYSLRTAVNDNAIVDGFLTLTHEDIPGLLTYFVFGEGYMYDKTKMQEDIEKYGLYTYEEWKEYVSYNEFVALNGKYMTIPIGKGYLTREDVLRLIKGLR